MSERTLRGVDGFPGNLLRSGQFQRSTRTRERVGEPQFDKRLPAYTDSLRFAVNRVKQIDRKIDVHALDFTAWTSRIRQIKMRAEILARVVHLIKTSGAQRPSPRGTSLLRLHAPAGPG
jgi:putative component of toxin-antitoxin plasmid stabilization module